MPTLSSRRTDVPETDICGQAHSFNCTRIKDLGYIAGKRLNLYGEHFQMISDPFTEEDGVAVRVISGDNPTVRTIRLPVSILVGLSDLHPQAPG
jgi:hypothetical protein